MNKKYYVIFLKFLKSTYLLSPYRDYFKVTKLFTLFLQNSFLKISISSYKRTKSFFRMNDHFQYSPFDVNVRCSKFSEEGIIKILQHLNLIIRNSYFKTLKNMLLPFHFES